MPISQRRVSGSGPKPARIAFVGEGPGRDEDESGRAFTGPSGKVLWAMAGDYAGLKRSDVYVTNLSPFRLTDDRGKDRPPTPAEAAEWTPALRAELREVDPALIVTLGRWSTGAVLGRSLDMAVCNGMVYGSPRRMLIPVTHPAAGLHQPQMLAATAFGLQSVGAWLRGEEVEQPRDEHPKPNYFVADGRWPRECAEVAIDTEGFVDDPWSLQYSIVPGAACLIRANDLPMVTKFALWLAETRPAIIFHHALHDIAVLSAMGIDVLAMGLPFQDTMIELFLRQTDPQGLKASAERLCGMQMREYRDVVGPVQEEFARRYLLDAIKEPPGEWTIGEGRKHSILKRIDGLLYPRPTRGEAKTITEKWDDESFAVVRAAVEAVSGPMPSPRMDDIPKEEFIAYACRDPDAALRQSRVLSPSIDALGLRRVHKVDHDALPLVARMQQVGMLVDTQRLDELRQYVGDEIAAAVDVIATITGDRGFNPASGDQVAAYCIAKGLPMERMTKGGGRIQVNEDQLMLVRFADPAIEHILYFRELDKLRGTYIEPLPSFLKGDGRYRRLHPSYRTTAAITGRLSCGGDSPNLMAFPSRTELGRRIRACFVAGEGKVLGSADLCVAEGTLVDTPNGMIAVETLQPGALVFSYSKERRRPIVSKVNQLVWVGRKPVLRIMLDNGKSVLCTPEHKWLVCPVWQHDDPVRREASRLKVGDRLLPLRRINCRGYVNLYAHAAIEYSKEHVEVALATLGPRPPSNHIHHLDHHPANNHPKNLIYKDARVHWSEHGKETAKNCWANPETRIKMSNGIKDALEDRGGHRGENNPRYGDRRQRVWSACLLCDDSFESYVSQGKKYCSRICYHESRRVGLNHKIVAIESAGEAVVWNLGVEGTHNYALEAGVFTCNSQIELRVGAGLSQDEAMMEVYARDGDIHASTASGVFGVPEAELHPTLQRYPAKTMNFLILFGGREHRLYAEMLRAGVEGFDVERCIEMIARWFALYPGVERWIADTMAFGAEHGYVLTEAGRRRYTPALRFDERMGYPFSRLREEAMRQASNFPIQGTAQEIMKRAMPAMRYIDHMEPLLQVHDEVIVEVQEGHEDAVGEQMVAAMTAESPWQGVKITASWRTANDWSGLK